LMEVGPTRNASLWSRKPDGASGSVGGSGYSYEPYYDEELLAIWSFYANLHYDLLDYIVAQAELSHETGTPIVRPMIAMYPQKEEYLDLFGQYLFGPDILVAPVWQRGLTHKQVLIPPEGVWVDAWSSMEHQADEVVVIDTPIYKVPIFVRKDSGVDLGDLAAQWQAAKTRVADKPNLAELAQGVE
jgi:alpha-glucosidase (family GH31 glycosyl hydrolase)